MAPEPRNDADISRRCFDRILLVKPSSLGDVIHALPVLHGLRTRFPSAKIDWLIAAPHAAMLEDHAEIDELVVFDRKRLGRLGRSLGVAGELGAFLRGLRLRRYDLVVDLQGLFRTGVFTRASGAPVRIGFRDARECARLFYTHHLQRGSVGTHAVDRNYRVAELLGFEDVPVTFGLPLTDSTRSQAAELLRGHGVGESEALVVVAPGARWETKRWGPKRFAGAIDAYTGRIDARTILVGSPDEATLCEQIAKACRSEPINLAGASSLACLTALVERSDTVLCHDSAVMHLAVALGRPLVSIVGPTNPDRTGPYRRPHDVVRVELDCSPCYFRRLSQCGHDHRCMVDLQPERIADAVCARLSSSETASGAGGPASSV